MADEKSWVEKYIAKVQKALKARTGEESMLEKHAKKKKKKKKKNSNPNTQTGPAGTVKYN